MDASAALKLVADVDEIYSARGKSVAHVDLRMQNCDEERLRDLLLGPTGNLRAPTLRVRRTLLVGFDAATYREVLH